MRIFETQSPSGDVVADVTNVIDQALHTTAGCPRQVVVEMILHRLGGAGYAMARREDLLTATAPVSFKIEPVETETAEPGDTEASDTDVSPARAPITATRGRVVFIGQVHGREILRWTRSGAPVHSYRKDEPVFDLEALVAWMDKVQGTLDAKRRVGPGRPRLGDLIGPRRRLIAEINRRREREIELRDGEAEAKAVKAAALLEGAAEQIGWSGIEDLTGLRHVPRAGRAA